MTRTDTMKVDLPTTRDDSTAFGLAEMASLNVYQLVNNVPTKINTVSLTGNTAQSIHVAVAGLAAGSYGFQYTVVDTNGTEGDFSQTYPVVVKAPLAPPAAPTVESDAQT